MFYVSLVIGCGVFLSVFFYKSAMKEDETVRSTAERGLRNLANNDESIYL